MIHQALSILPNLSVVAVSERAWKVIEKVDYVGYDALMPWKTAVEDKYFPYTFDWHSLTALHMALSDIQETGAQKLHSLSANSCCLLLCSVDFNSFSDTPPL